MEEPKEGTAVNEPVAETPNQPVEQPIVEPEKTSFTMDDVRKLIQEEAANIGKGYQRVIAKKDNELKALKATTNAEPNVDVGTLRKIVSALTASGGDETAVADAERSLDEAEKKVKMASQLTYQQKVISDNLKKCEETIEKAGLTEDDPRLVNYELAFEMAKQTGDFSVPERVLNKIIKTVPVQKEEKKEVKMSEEEIEKRVAERLKQEVAKLKNLKSDAGAVAGGGASGRKPSLEEVRSASPEEFDKKVKSGEWKL